jgi:hypothetical protein
MLCSIEVSLAKEFTMSELLLRSVVIPACRESFFLKARKDSGQTGMTENKHSKKITVFATFRFI